LFNYSIVISKYRDVRGRFVISPPRDKQGRFTSVIENNTVLPLTSNVLEGLVGSLLGDGSLRANKKDSTGKIKHNTNCMYAITLKVKSIFTIYEIYFHLYVPYLNLGLGLIQIKVNLFYSIILILNLYLF
jgi:hypothetical protein